MKNKNNKFNYKLGNGGKLKPPIIVNDKNDPRLKAYNDSLKTYNNSESYFNELLKMKDNQFYNHDDVDIFVNNLTKKYPINEKIVKFSQLNTLPIQKEVTLQNGQKYKLVKDVVATKPTQPYTYKKEEITQLQPRTNIQFEIDKPEPELKTITNNQPMKKKFMTKQTYTNKKGGYYNNGDNTGRQEFDLGGMINGAQAGSQMGSSFGIYGKIIGGLLGAAGGQVGDILGQNRELTGYDKIVNNTQLAFGGNMTESINAGGTHEQNPNEGVNIGNQGLVEEGEVIYNFKDKTGDNKYVFSKRLGFANKAKSIMKKFDIRPNDRMATEAKEQQLKNLMDKQEVVRSSMFDNQFKKAFGGKLKKYPWGGDWNYTKKPGEFDPTTFNINANTNPILVDPNNNSQFLQKDYIPTDPNTTSFISGFNHLLNPDVYPEGTYEISSSSLGKEQEPQVNTRFYTPKEDPTAEKNWAYLRRVDPVTMKPANMKNPSLNIGLGDNSMFGFPNAGKKIQPVSSSTNIDYLGTFNKPLTNEFVGSNGPILAEKNKPLYQKPNTKADKPKVDKGYNKGLNKSGQYGQFAGALGKLAVAASGPDAVNLQRMKNHNISSLPEEIQASNELNQIYNNANRDIRNNAGSNAGSFLASRIASAGNQADKTGQVLSGIRSKYNEFNTRNNMAVDQFNTQTSHTEDDLRTREKDAVRTLLMDAASQAGNVNANINRDNMGYKNEQDLLGLMQSQDFNLEQDPTTGRYKLSSKYKKGFGGFMYKSKSKKK